MNLSKVKDERFWTKWRNSGAVGTIFEEDDMYYPGIYLVHANCTRCGWTSATHAFYYYIDPKDEFSPDEEQIQEAIGNADKELQKLHDESSNCNSVISCY